MPDVTITEFYSDPDYFNKETNPGYPYGGVSGGTGPGGGLTLLGGVDTRVVTATSASALKANEYLLFDSTDLMVGGESPRGAESYTVTIGKAVLDNVPSLELLGNRTSNARLGSLRWFNDAATSGIESAFIYVSRYNHDNAGIMYFSVTDDAGDRSTELGIHTDLVTVNTMLEAPDVEIGGITAYGSADHAATIGSTTLTELGGIELIGNQTSVARVGQITFHNAAATQSDKKVAEIYGERGTNDNTASVKTRIADSTGASMDLAYAMTATSHLLYIEGTETLYLTENGLVPWANDDLYLGWTTLRWSGIYGVNIDITGTISFTDTNTQIWEDGSSNLTFKDAVTGTKTLAELAAGGGASSPLTTKGDLWGYSTLDARIAVGTDGQALVADSSEALGVKWDTWASTVYTTTLTDNTTTNIVIGDTTNNRGITLRYSMVRGSDYRSGVIDILNSGGVVSDDGGSYLGDSCGLTLSSEASGGNIRLNCLLTSTGDNATFEYVLIYPDYSTNGSTTSYTFGNGLTESGGAVSLGGTLTGHTTISPEDYHFMIRSNSVAEDSSSSAIFGDNMIQFGVLKEDDYSSDSGYLMFNMSEYPGGEFAISMECHNAAGAKTFIYIDEDDFTLTDAINSKGAYYAADYSSGATARWIPDKAYVDSVAGGGGGSYTFSSLLTENSDGSVDLGGTATGNTTLDLDEYYIDIVSSNTSQDRSSKLLQTPSLISLRSFFEDDKGTANGYSMISVHAHPTTATECTAAMEAYDGSGDWIAISLSEAGIVITDEINSKGLYYAADYSSGATARWIPDKAYVDSVAGGGGGSYSFENGLEVSSDLTATLGGDLIENTVIYGDSNTYSLSFTDLLTFEITTEETSVASSFTMGDGGIQSTVTSGTITSTIRATSSAVNLYYEDSSTGEISGFIFNEELSNHYTQNDAGDLFSFVAHGDDGVKMYIRIGSAEDISRILISSTEMIVLDEVNSLGLYYAADYSSSATDRWIPDKAYVDSVAGSGIHGNHTGHVTSVNMATTLTVAAITGQTALTSGLVSTDELLISDGGVIKRMDVSVVQAYMQSNLSFGGAGYWTDNGTSLSPSTSGHDILLAVSTERIMFGDGDTYIYEQSDDVLWFVHGANLALSLEFGTGAIFSGHILPDADKSNDIGSASLFWDDAFLDRTYIYDTGNWINGNSGSISIYVDSAQQLYLSNTLIYSYKDFRPGGNKTLDLGASSYFWDNVYVDRLYIDDTSTYIDISSGDMTFTDTNSGTVTLASLVSGGGSMVYPGAGIALSTGSAWGTSITDNSANWNTAYGWGDHDGVYLLLTGSTLGDNDTEDHVVAINDSTGLLTKRSVASLGGGSGDVSAYGTPVDNQIAVWTDPTTIEGDNNFTWDATTAKITRATTSAIASMLFLLDTDAVGTFNNIGITYLASARTLTSGDIILYISDTGGIKAQITGDGTLSLAQDLYVGDITAKYNSSYINALVVASTGSGEASGIEIVGNQTTDSTVGSITWHNTQAVRSDKIIGKIAINRYGDNDAGKMYLQIADNTGAISTGVSIAHDYIKQFISGTDVLTLSSVKLNPTIAGGLDLGSNTYYWDTFYTNDARIKSLAGSGIRMATIDSDGDIGVSALVAPVIDGTVAGTLYTGGSSTQYSTDGASELVASITISNAEYEGSADGTRIFEFRIGGRYKSDANADASINLYLGTQAIFAATGIADTDYIFYEIYAKLTAISSTQSAVTGYIISQNLAKDDEKYTLLGSSFITHGSNANFNIYADHSTTAGNNPWITVETIIVTAHEV